mmetsp:Transcript_22518/g.76012  ORF Transcript_22518/g.76012 Transcript_22518/m.76012 type:complete len:505 (-) Transcript_22518:38-1552(-)
MRDAHRCGLHRAARLCFARHPPRPESQPRGRCDGHLCRFAHGGLRRLRASRHLHRPHRVRGGSGGRHRGRRLDRVLGLLGERLRLLAHARPQAAPQRRCRPRLHGRRRRLRPPAPGVTLADGGPLCLGARDAPPPPAGHARDRHTQARADGVGIRCDCAGGARHGRPGAACAARATHGRPAARLLPARPRHGGHGARLSARQPCLDPLHARQVDVRRGTVVGVCSDLRRPLCHGARPADRARRHPVPGSSQPRVLCPVARGLLPAARVLAFAARRLESAVARRRDRHDNVLVEEALGRAARRHAAPRLPEAREAFLLADRRLLPLGRHQRRGRPHARQRRRRRHGAPRHLQDRGRVALRRAAGARRSHRPHRQCRAHRAARQVCERRVAAVRGHILHSRERLPPGYEARGGWRLRSCVSTAPPTLETIRHTVQYVENVPAEIRGSLPGHPYCCSVGLTLATVVGEPHCCSVVTVNTSNTVHELLTLNSSSQGIELPVSRASRVK